MQNTLTHLLCSVKTALQRLHGIAIILQKPKKAFPCLPIQRSLGMFYEIIYLQSSTDTNESYI